MASPEIDPLLFRQTLGRFATGVTVISVPHGDHAHGMTANAFLSVSLDPPLVLISIAQRARLHQLLGLGDRYGVSILAESQELLSRQFGGRPLDWLDVSFIWEDGIPLLRGAVAHLFARVVDIHPAGDHTLFIGQVEYLNYNDGHPLLFYAGAYGQLTDQRDTHVAESLGFGFVARPSDPAR
jgi:flavin reductase (DIM6/NTAB) family NADH-FMN oxidoreductase RutF